MSEKTQGATFVQRVKELREELGALRQRLEDKETQLEDYLSRLRYLQADFENYRKRMEKQRAEQIAMANTILINKMLRVYEDLERSVEEAKTAEVPESVVEGFEMIWKNFQSVLEDEGLSIIETEGEEFDPFLHEAVEIQEKDCEPGIILEEVQRGYTFRGKVLRPAKVKVCRKPAQKNKQEKD
jgi:molecular chaperone GrpE